MNPMWLDEISTLNDLGVRSTILNDTRLNMILRMLDDTHLGLGYNSSLQSNRRKMSDVCSQDGK
jgi:hypothetical protein